MAFFSRPNLDDVQFKQLSGTTLTLSGTTIFNSVCGGHLNFTDEDGVPIPVVISSSGKTEANVLQYCATTGELVLKKASTGGTSTGIYDGLSPSTCTVGGMPSGTTIYGCCITDILQCILVPTLYPTLTNPSSTFTITCLPTTSTGYYEMGTTVYVTGCSMFNRGIINPQYPPTIEPYRSGLPVYHYYSDWGSFVTCTTSDLNNSISFTPYIINNSSQTVNGSVYYSCGTQPYDSDGFTGKTGVCELTPLPSGCTAVISRCVRGVYPYYWGKITCAVAPGLCRPSGATIVSIITGGTANCCVAPSTSTISINFGSTSNDYIWFATPVASTTKTCWYVDALNSGGIGGAVSPGGCLFPSPSSVTGITTTLWSDQTFKVYISNYQSAASVIMQLRNS